MTSINVEPDTMEPDDPAARTTTASVGRADAMDVGTMKMARVGERRIAVIRTASGYHALDNACPHQGYGLVTGTLTDDLVTCQWHNWKFCVTDGTCVVGEENVASHPVEIVDGEVVVSVTEPTAAERLAALWPSLRSGIEKDYRGQIARDTARLLAAGADPVDVLWEGLRVGAPRADYGVGHEMATAADCLALVDHYEGLERTLPLAQALTGISEVTRDRPARSLPDPTGPIDVPEAIETEEHDDAVAGLLHALDEGAERDEVLAWFVDAVGRHHLSYGHGAIYTQKAFELLDRAGFERARDLLPHLVTAIVHGTREDTLPYMRTAMRAIEAVDIGALAEAGAVRDPAWSDVELRRVLLEAPQAPIEAAVDAVLGGAGIEGLLDAVTLAVSERLLRYDVANEHDHSYDFGWLDLTHGLTYARAARWVWRQCPGPAAARLALFTVFLCHDTGRAERHHGGAAIVSVPTPADGDVEQAVLDGRVDDAVAHALAGDIDRTGAALARVSLADRSGAFIVMAHIVKLSRAAYEEAMVTGSTLPLAAAARFAAAPRRERFVSGAVAEAIDFVTTGRPPAR